MVDSPTQVLALKTKPLYKKQDISETQPLQFRSSAFKDPIRQGMGLNTSCSPSRLQKLLVTSPVSADLEFTLSIRRSTYFPQLNQNSFKTKNLHFSSQAPNAIGNTCTDKQNYCCEHRNLALDLEERPINVCSQNHVGLISVIIINFSFIQGTEVSKVFK